MFWWVISGIGLNELEQVESEQNKLIFFDLAIREEFVEQFRQTHYTISNACSRFWCFVLGLYLLVWIPVQLEITMRTRFLEV